MDAASQRDAPTAGANFEPDPAGAARKPMQLGRPIWLAIVAVAIATIIGNYIVMARELSRNSYFLAADFIVFWTAAGASQPYDFEALTVAQRWYIESDALRPFAYPPSFLPWVEPFGRLPLIPAHALWIALTGALFLFAWSRILPKRPLLLALVAPTTLLAAIPGQVVFLVGGLLVLGVSMLKARPVWAGILFGIAATIKPQTLLLVPLALVAGHHWRTLAAAILSGAAVGLACLALQGHALWLAWAEALPRFMTTLRDVEMIHFGITPAAALEAAQIEGWAAHLFTLLAAACGLLTVWKVFRSSDDAALRLLALSASTLLLLPYAMPYELALCAPAAAAMLLDRKASPIVPFAGFMLFTAAGKALAIAVLCAVLIWMVRRDGNLVPRAAGTPQPA